VGPRPADEALRTLDALLPDNPTPWTLMTRAWLLTMLARFEEASQIASEAGERGRELTGDDSVDFMLGYIATIPGDHEAAATHLRRTCDLLEAHSERNFLSTAAPMLGRSLCALGRHDEAEPLARLGREIGDERDLATQTLWRQVQALVHASRGLNTDAEALAREPVAITERTDGLNMQGDAFCDLAEVLHAAGRGNEAASTLGQALERYERKMNLAQAAQVRERLAELQDSASR
jgi:tetratricopeptide (TPR) repeat protein